MSTTPSKAYAVPPRGTRRFWIFSGSIAGLIVLLAILIAANIILSTVHLRKDLTEEKIFTLSEGTRHVLTKLEGPVTLKFFFTERSPDVPIPFKNFARQVSDLLKEYQLVTGGNITIETYDPQPDSDAEEWAERYGLARQNLSLLGAGESFLYLGIVAVKGDAYSAIPFIDPRTEELLEYNITRMIARIANPKKPVVGIMSSLPVMGIQTFPYAMPGQPRPQNRPPWVAFQNLAEDYDVRQVSMDAEQIDADIDALIVVHPKNLTDSTQFAMDQFVLRGGRLLAFVDPLCLTDISTQDQPMMGMGAPKPSSDLGKLTSAWGITYEPDKVVADLEASTRIRQGDNAVDDSPVFLSLREKNIDGKDVITAQLESLILPCAGSFEGTGPASLSVGSLLVSSAQSQPMNAMTAQMGSEVLRRDFKPGLKRMNLAIRLHGQFKTAFPEGKPKAEPKPDSQETGEKAPEKAEEGSAHLKESTTPTTIILVGDADMLFDQFAVQELNFFGHRVFQPINDNINFFANAVEQLAGSADLAKIRSRGRFERPFDRVLALQHEAQQRWLLQERALQEKLESTRQRLEALQSKKDKSQRYILSHEQEQEINNFKQEQIKTQRELKQVRKHLREGIERLGVMVKIINIVLMPGLVIMAGITFGLYRHYKPHQ